MQKILALSLLLLTFNLLASEEACRVQMDDSLNKDTTVLSVEKESETKYVVTDHNNYITKPEPLIVDVYVEEGKVSGDAGVPGGFEIADFKELYKMENDSQLTWTVLSGDCDDLKKAMIYYLVMEWFYFG